MLALCLVVAQRLYAEVKVVSAGHSAFRIIPELQHFVNLTLMILFPFPRLLLPWETLQETRLVAFLSTLLLASDMFGPIVIL